MQQMLRQHASQFGAAVKLEFGDEMVPGKTVVGHADCVFKRRPVAKAVAACRGRHAQTQTTTSATRLRYRKTGHSVAAQGLCRPLPTDLALVWQTRQTHQ